MRYYNDISQLIGNTPLVKLNKVIGNTKATVLAKLEFFNPGGSVKDRIAMAMIQDAERKGFLKPGATIIEPTSGNTGVGLAMVATLKGYKTIFTMPDKVSIEKELLLRAFGAEVVRCPTDVSPEDPRSYYKVAERLAEEIPNSFILNQYNNMSNPRAHFETTGPEIWRDTEGKITHFVAGIGTGGTISGVGRYLKNKNPNIRVIAADPEGSLYHHEFYGTRGDIHQYVVEGIGEDFIPATIDFDVIDEIVVVSDEEAFAMTRELVKKEGILAGGSSGAAVVAAVEIAKNLDEEALIVVLLPDTGRNYLSKIFIENHARKDKAAVKG